VSAWCRDGGGACGFVVRKRAVVRNPGTLPGPAHRGL